MTSTFYSGSEETSITSNAAAHLQKRFTLIWHTDKPQEREWVEEIFGNYVKDYVTDGRHQIVLDDCILCDAYIQRKHFSYYQQFRGKNAFLVHFLDENYERHYDVYQNFKAVFRQFWSSAFNSSYIKALPLGYNVGISLKSAPKPALDRKYIWSFIGQTNKSSRPDVVRELLSFVPNYLYSTDHLPGFTGLATVLSKKLSAAEYKDILDDSIFAPSPMGNVNLECFRVYEALERGAIPIVERRVTLDYFRSLLGEHPIPTIKNWREAGGLVKSLLSSPSDLEELQKTCIQWWQKFKQSLSYEVGELIAARLPDDATHDRPLYAPRANSRWWQTLELLRHHDLAAARRRVSLQAHRLSATGKLRVAYRP